MPTYPPDKKLSKNEILRLAIKYIRLLSNVLEYQKKQEQEEQQITDNNKFSIENKESITRTITNQLTESISYGNEYENKTIRTIIGQSSNAYLVKNQYRCCSNIGETSPQLLYDSLINHHNDHSNNHYHLTRSNKRCLAMVTTASDYGTITETAGNPNIAKRIKQTLTNEKFSIINKKLSNNHQREEELENQSRSSSSSSSSTNLSNGSILLNQNLDSPELFRSSSTDSFIFYSDSEQESDCNP